jgi:hypothetical protein
MSNKGNELVELGEAKKFFELGAIVGFNITRAPLHAGKWVIGLQGKEFRHWTVATKGREVKIYSSLETAVGQLEQIAGREIVSLHGSF